MGESLVTFETNDKIVKYSSELGFNDIKFPFAYGEENIYFMIHQNHVPIKEYRNSTEKNEYQFLYEKDGELKSDVDNESIVECGNDFNNCKFINA